MDWLELKIDTSPAGIDPVTEMLTEQGVTGVIIDDQRDFQDFMAHNQAYWDYVDEELVKEKENLCRVTFYVENAPAGYSAIAAIRMAMHAMKQKHPEYAPLLLTMENVKDEDWENNWKQFYKPMEIGERLLVIPAWEQADPKGRVTLTLNPGLTFGTGSHATTRLCLTALESRIHGGERVLDLGCGSGILSIAALRLGAKSAFACDIDEKCVDVAYENAALNGIGKDRLTVRQGDATKEGPLRDAIGTGYDVVVANIVADVIISLAPQVRHFLKEDGWFLTSGIIDDRADEVAAALVAEGSRRRAACMGGMLTVLDGEVRLVATTWEWAEQIDHTRAEAAKKRAEEILARKDLDRREYEMAQARLKRALVRTSIKD